MKVHLPNILPSNFNPTSKVWIYQSNRMFAMNEVFEIEPMLENFADQWTSHGAPVKGFGTLLYGQFIILMAEESVVTLSGCSMDSSVHLIKEIENKTGVQLFNRDLLAFWIKDKVQIIPLTQVGYALENGLLQKETLYFNNLVNTKSDIEANWLQPISESWLGKKFIQ